MAFKNITIAGTGVLGSQIAYQTALNGFSVTAYDLNPADAKKRVEALRDSYKHDLKLSDEDFDKGLASLTFTDDLGEAVKDSDYVIEALPESLKIKESFYQELSKKAPEKTVFASNSSTMIPSQLVKFVDRPQKFLNMHFANRIWKCNVAEIMGTAQTDPAIFQEVVDFARAIKMVPIEIHKEQPGYVLNSLLIPFLFSAMSLWVKGVAEPETVDKDWMISTGSPVGPFMMLDDVGLRTAWNISNNLYESKKQEIFKIVADKLKEKIDAGEDGIESGHGFYTYPHPAFEDPDFLKK
ncbi:MAG: 3-hydroxyacyl-CoA dehydrogenase [Limosilactobacillus sp.]|jgi:3-hydroxybutyryl-CoA dehydrogenase|uniref:3-hydroxyacyl-CoA dehydrogenase n=1 Tax=Limosilactobacillus sp. TaxID=2773925 RepID=UPI0025C5DCC8|nr:3-hydroxyacyl-CoA dehydrogenase [Limosilactobacillus sp.]MCI1974717.1 3-hydroxyacyl-CoA dehydrogenase [Limosilactobacillus sp.]MCI2030726.1 3-hydroxyacyl-CoA dehydrogenase [Limosilactobacillus sp.]